MTDKRCVDDLNDLERRIYNAIVQERDRQKSSRSQDGDRVKPPAVWIGILAKQLGQASAQVIVDDDVIDILMLKKQLTQMAAVAAAWIEVLEIIQ
ncbi:MAG: hypothetical protein KAS32_13500 [Candidatus Peribacteraceae bacterium]|nr:hypothetical protein [Candidatus Peribacteraceae bacterium]